MHHLNVGCEVNLKLVACFQQTLIFHICRFEHSLEPEFWEQDALFWNNFMAAE